MKLLVTDQVLNLTTYKELPNGTLKHLFIRWAGTNQAGQAVTLAQLGQVRVNYRGTDIVNESVAFFSLWDNLNYGVAEFVSNVGGTFAASIKIPFHAVWDEKVGLFNDPNYGAYVELRNVTTAVVIATGTVQISFEEAQANASYLTYYLQENLAVGGAGQQTQDFTGIDISSLYLETNAQLTNVFVAKDTVNKVSSDQNTLLADSNMTNRVETAIALYEVPMNPYKYIPAGGKLVQFIGTYAAATIQLIHTLGFAMTPDAAIKSQQYYERLPRPAPISATQDRTS